ncbi:hypothetical protein ASC78_21275 [Variovorax sp. Root318D1]|uniref:Zn-ribbon domain-containing OB-fold protein n=1 Tax=Variovorax sp. Root318D1 TaxID=1736513 RepID=UPI0006F339B5|nr:zinc ribbon domain-containing protein [Variovorax sp. Root318D1]KQU89713.1 hypothetical protein ASC78_21275 [Variovorax sp. Root318D1]
MTEQQTTLKPLHPTLYELAEDGHSLDFFFVQCGACGAVSFPANVPGCTHCGDPLVDAQKLSRPGGGELLEYVTLHVPLVPGMAAPSIAGDIRIADGIVEEGVIWANDETSLRPGMTLRAVAEVREAQGVYACRFVPADAKVTP